MNLIDSAKVALGLGYGRTRAMYDLLRSEQEGKRKALAQKLWDYYVGDSPFINAYLIEALKKTFSVDTINEMQLPYLLIVKRIVDRLAMAYKSPAERYILDDDKSNENYQLLLESSNINAQAKRWQRYGKLLDTVLVQPVFRDNSIQYDIFQPHLITVQEDPENYLKVSEIIFQQFINGKLRSIYWSKDEHMLLEDNGTRIKDETNPDGINPYGILPFAVYHARENEVFWGEGDTELININEKINVLLCSAFFNAIMQSHGQAVAINTGIKGEIRTGPNHIIRIDNAFEGNQAPSFHFEQPKPAVEEAMRQIDWMVKSAVINRGLPPSSVSTEVKAQSGAAKAIDSIELIEAREDDIEILRPFEKELFIISATIWNKENPGKPINPQANFCIDFEEPKMPESELDELAAKQQKLSLGLWTPVDDLIDEDEGIDEAEALSILQKNLEIRNNLNDQYGLSGFGLAPKTDTTGGKSAAAAMVTPPKESMTMGL